MDAHVMDCSEADGREFVRRVTAVVQRALAQTGGTVLSALEAEGLTGVLVQIGTEGGWARRAGCGELRATEVAAWVGRVVAAVPARGPEFAGLAKQLIKACFQPAPANCRDSYIETDGTGRCRRQERAYDLARISGAHCVDCPHWAELTQTAHVAWLGKRWHAGSLELEAHCGVFLPEDFRSLRCWRP